MWGDRDQLSCGSGSHKHCMLCVPDVMMPCGSASDMAGWASTGPKPCSGPVSCKCAVACGAEDTLDSHDAPQGSSPPSLNHDVG
jgi:hypothetical protein